MEHKKQNKQRHNELSAFRQQEYNTRTLLLSFAPVLLTVILYVVAFFADFAIISIIKSRSGETFSNGENSGEDALSMLMGSSFNAGLMNIIRFSLFLVIFGCWYHHSFCNTTVKGVRQFQEKPVRAMLTPVNVILFAILGYMIQISVDCLLQLFSNVFPKTFTEYYSLINSMAGADVSILMIISVTILAPISEEIIFRGLTLRYAGKIMPAWLAIIFQATGFGIYHGNLVQGIYAFLIGIFFGILVYKTDSLIPSVLLHCFVNISAYLVPSFLFDSNIKAAITLAASLGIGTAALIVLIREFQTKTTAR